MDFRLTDEQQLLVDTARALFAKECPSSLVRSAIHDPTAAAPLFDRHLRDWVALAGGPLVDLSLFLVEAGVAVAPGPFVVTAGLFAPLLVACGHPRADDAVNGAITGTVSFPLADGDGGDGARCRLIDADLVDHVAVVGAGPTLAVCPVGELSLQPVETFDLVRRSFSFDRGGEGGGRSVEASAVGDAVERATVAIAAESVGVARWLLDASVAYARERVQFGRPIGSFQAVQHRLVDMALAYEQAAAAVAYAAMCIDADDDDRHRAVHVAKAEAGTAARRCAKDGMQVHGGIGYTWEHDLHLRLRRAYANDALFGTTEDHLTHVAAELFDR